MNLTTDNQDPIILIIILALIIGLLLGSSLSTQADYTHKAIDNHCTKGHYLITKKATYYCELVSEDE